MDIFLFLLFLFIGYFYGIVIAASALKANNPYTSDRVAVLRAIWWPLIILRWIILNLIKCIYLLIKYIRTTILWVIGFIGDLLVEGWLILKGE